ncbi:hypothetical protein KJZ99_00075 [bacterium]|nr:hypothetical protein [bacterium]
MKRMWWIVLLVLMLQIPSLAQVWGSPQQPAVSRAYFSAKVIYPTTISIFDTLVNGDTLTSAGIVVEHLLGNFGFRLEYDSVASSAPPDSVTLFVDYQLSPKHARAGYARQFMRTAAQFTAFRNYWSHKWDWSALGEKPYKIWVRVIAYEGTTSKANATVELVNW